MVSMSVLSVRLDSELEKKIQFLMEKRKIVDKSAFIRQLIDRSLNEEITDYLCEEVKKGRLTAWKAAEILKISLRAMLKELADRDILSYTELSLKEDLDFIMREDF